MAVDNFGRQNNVKMTADTIAALTTSNVAKALLDCGKWLTVVVWQYARRVCLFLVLMELMWPSAH